MTDTIYIDCYGTSYLGEINVSVDGVSFVFIFDEEKKKGKNFHYGLFLDDAMASRKYLKYPKKRRLAALLESPVRPIFQQATSLSKRFELIFTHWKPLLDLGLPYKCLYYGTSWLGDIKEGQTFPKSKLVSFIGSLRHGDDHGYSLRKSVAEILIEDPGVDCFGYGIREIESKMEGLADYCFSIAMENTQQDYYFTEKIIDCFLAETVPVYWGCPSISQIFDERGMMVFNNLDDLKQGISGFTFEKHEEMLPFVIKNRAIAYGNRLFSIEGIYERIASELVRNSRAAKTSTLRTALFDFVTKLT